VASGEPIVLVGVPSDANSSYLRGAARAPDAIRRALHCESANMITEGGIDLSADGVLIDAGDLPLGDDGQDFEAIEHGIAKLVARGRVVSMGGDHAVTHPIIRAHRERYPELAILHFDAHPDLYDLFDGNPRSHASPFARILEEGLVQRLVQVGIRTMNPHQRAQVERFGVEVIEMRAWDQVTALSFSGPVYVSFDMDVLDPAFAPGVSHWEPGGASTRQVLDALHGLDATIVGADVVELNPERDPTGLTAMVAARVLREIAGRILE
jgi:arginase